MHDHSTWSRSKPSGKCWNPPCIRSGWKYADEAEHGESLEPEDRRNDLKLVQLGFQLLVRNVTRSVLLTHATPIHDIWTCWWWQAYGVSSIIVSIDENCKITSHYELLLYPLPPSLQPLWATLISPPSLPPPSPLPPPLPLSPLPPPSLPPSLPSSIHPSLHSYIDKGHNPELFTCHQLEQALADHQAVQHKVHAGLQGKPRMSVCLLILRCAVNRKGRFQATAWPLQKQFVFHAYRVPFRSGYLLLCKRRTSGTRSFIRRSVQSLTPPRLGSRSVQSFILPFSAAELALCPKSHLPLLSILSVR